MNLVKFYVNYLVWEVIWISYIKSDLNKRVEIILKHSVLVLGPHFQHTSLLSLFLPRPCPPPDWSRKCIPHSRAWCAFCEIFIEHESKPRLGVGASFSCFKWTVIGSQFMKARLPGRNKSCVEISISVWKHEMCNNVRASLYFWFWKSCQRISPKERLGLYLFWSEWREYIEREQMCFWQVRNIFVFL